MSKIFFTSDTHFGHVNILAYCDRPFTDINHMNEMMIQRWNAVVGLGDTVYHLGDFSMGPKENVNIRKRLNGKVILIKGNHDKKDEIHKAAGFDEIHRYLEIEVDGYKLFLAHIPMHLDAGERWYPADLKISPPEHYDYFLCGHVHQQWKRKGKTINVGVDQWNMIPQTLSELLTAKDPS
jgi:calcineurin-like phosphoesterase family protein